jgi:hypothetical protein
MAKPQIPTPYQALALQLALATGRLRRLPGGWWVGDEHPEVPKGDVVVPDVRSVTAHTIKACAARDWMTSDGNFLATLTDAGRAALVAFDISGQHLPGDEPHSAAPAL